MSDRIMKRDSYITLEEALAKIPEDTIVYVGTESGSAWMVIAKCKDVMEALEEYSVERLGKSRKNIAEKTGKVKYYKEQIESLEKSKKIAEKTNDEFELKRVNNKLKKFYAELETAQRTIKNDKKSTENQGSFADRNVLDIYQHILVEPFGISIVIEGSEHGRYWSADEMENPPEYVPETKPVK